MGITINKVAGEIMEIKSLTIIIITKALTIIKGLIILDKETIWEEWEALISLSLQFHLIRIVVLKL